MRASAYKRFKANAGRDQETDRLLARELGVIGLMNIQFAIQNGEVFLLEVNPEGIPDCPFCTARQSDVRSPSSLPRSCWEKV